MRDDLRHAYRRLRHQQVFSLAVVIVLSLAIAAVSVVLAVADAVILRPLPYPAADRLVEIREMEPGNRGVLELSYRNYLDWRAQSRSFEDLAVMGSVNLSHRLTGLGEPTHVPTAAVSASFFRVLGAAPQRGRVFQDEDDHTNAAPVAVISFGFWQRRLGADPDVIGRTIMLDERSFEIVGMMPRTFDFPRGAEMWTPVVPELTILGKKFEVDALEARWFGVLFALGRLRPSIALEQARRELDAVNEGIDRTTGSRPPHPVVVTSFEERLLGRTRLALVLLLGAVVLILAIATANVATLFLMRAASAQQETAVRMAIGATLDRVFRLWIAEGTILFGTAAVAGIAAAWIFLPLAARLAPDSVYRIGDAQITPFLIVCVLAMALAAAVTASLLVTLLSAGRIRLLDTLKESAPVATVHRLAVARRTLVSGEVALALLLLVFAALTIRTFINLRELDLGFDPRGVITLDVSPSSRLEAQANREFYTPLVERLATVPEIEAVAAVYQRPLAHEGVGMDAGVLPDGYAPDDRAAWMRVGLATNREAITPGYFSVMRIPLREGRDFLEEDTETTQPVAILSEGAARRLFGDQPAVGRRLLADRGPDGQPRWRTIVGVVADVRYRGLQDVRFDLYVPHRQIDDSVKHLVIRANRNPLGLVARLRHEVRQIDPLAVVEGITTMDAIVDRAIAPWRLYMVLFTILGLLALMMATVGLYAVMRYAVVERWHELGVRTALGASARDLSRLVMGESAKILGTGLLIGLGLTLALVRVMTSIVFGVSPTDPTILTGTTGTLAALALLAAYVPTRMATRMDAATLLRSR